MNCILPLIPKKLQENDLYLRIADLLCLYENKWEDSEFSDYLEETNVLQRSGLTNSGGTLSWFSMQSWLEMQTASWEDPSYGGGPSLIDIGKITPIIPTDTIWESKSKLNNTRFNNDGFNLWQHAIDPYRGTNLIQRVLIETLQLDNARVLDWYEDRLPENYYSFVMESFPGWEKTDLLIESSNTLKNAESKLASLKDDNCKHRFILSSGNLDLDYVSDIYGNKYKETFLCFENISQHKIKYQENIGVNKFIHRYTDLGLIKFWEIFNLSSNLSLDWGVSNKIYRTYFHEHVDSYFKVQQLLPAVINDMQNIWSHGKTWEDYYTWNGIDITQLVRQLSIETGPDPKWSPDRHWEGELTWTGDLSSWTYRKPGCSFCECICDDNYIPGYEPISGKSLYTTKIFEKHTSEEV